MISKSKEQLLSLLLRSLPPVIDGGNEKNSVHFRQNKNLKTRFALETRTFISFNTAQQISLMIFDLDYINGHNAVAIYNLNEIVHFIYAGIGLVPTYICQTTKGYQFAFHLKNHVFTHQKKPMDYLKDIKEAVTKILGCDISASHRLYGVWRNPLKHPFWYFNEYDYELKQFSHLLEKKPKKAKEINLIKIVSEAGDKGSKNWPTIPTSALVDGQRHNKLFLMAVSFAYKTEGLSYALLFNYLISQNNLAKPPMEEKEVTAMAKYVFNKKLTGELYLSLRRAKDVDIGVMEFKKMKGLTREEYEAETKRRQRESAKRTNQLRADKNGEKIIDKIQNAIKKLTTIEKEVTILGVAKLTGLSRNTVKKYLPILSS